MLRHCLRGSAHFKNWQIGYDKFQSNLVPLTSYYIAVPNHRTFSKWVYESFFSPAPLDPTLWNNVIWGTQHLFTTFHAFTGVSWGYGIILCTALLRSSVTFPLLVFSEINNDRLKVLLLDIEKSGVKDKMRSEVKKVLKWLHHRENFSSESLKGVGQKLLNNNRDEYLKTEFAERNCHPFKGLVLPCVQIPLWVSCSIALRNMCGFYMVEGDSIVPTCPELINESFLWIPSLLEPSLTIGLLCGLLYFVLVEINIYKEFTGKPMPKRGRLFTNFLRVYSLGVVPYFSTIVPSALTLYWASSAAIGLIHNLLLMSPYVRRLLGITSGTSPDERPFQNVIKGFKSYWKL